MSHYIKPGFADRLLGAAVSRLARHGVSLAGAAELSVRGRVSGEWRQLPVNPLEFRDGHYLVSARGEGQWVRNLRAAGEGRLQVGSSVRRFTAVELPDEEKPAVLRAYLERWGRQVGRFFEGVTAEAGNEELLRIAARHPVFRISDVA
ncbi:nitroreductase family deazaflavin-dependent oxidoreductase [Streptomyces sp. NPDC052396]|uniref:nitroreductase family deazaflavin-dependent oxidoreductase n=1 Tax=Streptomyces sp. NPDC052396 TaxID=3365689 RepID=UPI0037D111AB